MVTFRRGELKDLKTALALLPLYYEYDGHPYDPIKAERGLRQLMTDARLGELWIVIFDSKPIGYFAISFGFSLECGGKEAFIDELFVFEEFRNQGIGRKAIEHAIKRCASNEVHALRLEVTNENSGALRLYEELGFEDLGRRLLTRWI